MRTNPLREKLESMTQEEIAGLYQRIFETPDGLLLLEHLKFKFFFYDTTTNEKYSAENEGNRQVILHLLKAMEIDSSPQEPLPAE